MLSDKELDEAGAQLAQFRVSHTDILDKYATLMDDFRRLKSEFEEARDSRDRYKSMAKGGERNPFVLVLVDGDGYVFDDDLLETKAEGGSRAAQLLNDSIQRSTRSRPGLENCNIMVRIYANVAGLSKAVSKVGLAGPEKRSLAPFVANFNRSNGLFDFVDAGELKENADFKIRALFRQFVENTQCRHIYFAACHDVGYVSELVPYASQRDRITLVRNYAFHKEFAKLGLRTEELPGIFKGNAIPNPYSMAGTIDMPPPPPTTSNQNASPAPMVSRHASSPSVDNDMQSKVCSFFQKGMCKYGKGCKFAHVKLSTNGNTQPGFSDSSDWRSPAKGDPFQNNDFTTGRSKVASTSDFSGLPLAENIPPSKIPVNASGERLDSRLPHISAEDRANFKARIARHKLCNNHHLIGYCANGAACQYDHSPISDKMKTCLLEVARRNPCPRRQNCRSLSCPHGHICQEKDCMKRGGNIFCKLPHPMHLTDPNVAEYEPSIIATAEEWSSVKMDEYHAKHVAMYANSSSSSSEEDLDGAQLSASASADDGASVD